ncbi:nitroreductase family protein [Pararobbsia silviterrae]|uniref:Nitroreductase family protein n=1 Tax=Pararobbsia silviterrae TaxID=1792498 RepID=A0A494YES0_9BURK|nr:nitroreductase family protein [Pararobbsia silviterrae]RKP59218.1 nitroreductase family protein [Pararobbsia silviterrae]
MTTSPRIAEHPIEQQFLERWSPRAYAGEPIPEATLKSLLEAARWAPSSYNAQPWRFVYARRDTPHWEQFLGFLNEFNQSWAKNASAIVIVISKTTSLPPGGTQEVPWPTHSFDTGAAWGYLALQASLSGWPAHGMVGILKDKIRAELGLPENYAVEAAVAIGKQGDKSILPEGLQQREAPSPRKPLSEVASEGKFIA